MSRIKSIHIHNFKCFDEQPAIELGETGKHLLFLAKMEVVKVAFMKD